MTSAFDQLVREAEVRIFAYGSLQAAAAIRRDKVEVTVWGRFTRAADCDEIKELRVFGDFLERLRGKAALPLAIDLAGVREHHPEVIERLAKFADLIITARPIESEWDHWGM